MADEDESSPIRSLKGRMMDYRRVLQMSFSLREMVLESPRGTVLEEGCFIFLPSWYNNAILTGKQRNNALSPDREVNFEEGMGDRRYRAVCREKKSFFNFSD